MSRRKVIQALFSVALALSLLEGALAQADPSVAQAIQRAKSAEVRVNLNELGMQPTSLFQPSPTPRPDDNTLLGLETRMTQVQTVILGRLNAAKGGIEAWVNTPQDQVDRRFPGIVDALANLCCKKNPYGSSETTMKQLEMQYGIGQSSNAAPSNGGAPAPGTPATGLPHSNPAPTSPH